MKNIVLLVCIIVMSYILLHPVVKFLSNNSYNSSDIEGMTGTTGTTSNNPLATAIIPAYNTTRGLSNIYSTLHYDSLNGNLIDLAPDPNNGNMILTIFSRVQANSAMGKMYDGTGSQNTKESLIEKMSSVQNGWCYNTGIGNGKCQIVYIGFDTDTYIHIFDLHTLQPKLLLSIYFQNQGSIDNYYDWNPIIPVPNSPSMTGNNDVTNQMNGTNVIEPYYDTTSQLFQIQPHLKYDTNNGNIIMQTNLTPKSINVYGRTGSGTFSVYDLSNNAMTSHNNKTISSSTGNLSVTGDSPFLIEDHLDGNFYIYWPVGNKTIISEFTAKLDSTSGQIPLSSFYLFIDNTIYNGISSANSHINTNNNISGAPCSDPDSKWYWYWQTVGGGDEPSDLMSNYMLKTEFVPPTCTECNGIGGNCVCNGPQGLSNGAQNGNGWTGGNGNGWTGTGGNGNGWTGGNGNGWTGTGDGNGYGGYGGYGIDAIGNGIGAIGRNGIGAVENGIGAIGNGIYNGIENEMGGNGIGNGLGNGIGAIGNGIGNGIGAIGNGIGDGIGAIGRGIGNGINGAENGWNRLTANGQQYSQTDAAASINSPISNSGYSQNTMGGGGRGGDGGGGGGGGGGGAGGDRPGTESSRESAGSAPGTGQGSGQGIAENGAYTLDPYSYNGQIPGHGQFATEPLPVTTDFSRFGR